MLIIAPVFPIAIEIEFNTMLIIDKITAAVHAHPIPFSRPYGNNERYNPIAIITPPITIVPLPTNEGQFLKGVYQN